MAKKSLFIFLIVFILSSGLAFSSNDPLGKGKENKGQMLNSPMLNSPNQIEPVVSSPTPETETTPEPTPQPSPKALQSLPKGFVYKKQKSEAFDPQLYRSRVANVVEELLKSADRLGGLGETIRNIAREQNQAATTTLQLMEKIRNRSRIKEILFGSDYKNLGELRSQLVRLRNRLEQLNQLKERITNEGERTFLENQIRVLEEEQAKIENFLKEKENQFSLLGWIRKLFKK